MKYTHVCAVPSKILCFSGAKEFKCHCVSDLCTLTVAHVVSLTQDYDILTIFNK